MTAAHFTDVAMLMALFGMPAGIIFVIGLFLGWWESGRYAIGGAPRRPARGRRGAR